MNIQRMPQGMSMLPGGIPNMPPNITTYNMNSN
jgi:hypothetical protein